MKDVGGKIISWPVIYITIAFAVWLFCFRGYFLGQLGFSSDAISYYDHIRFFLTNLMQGHFPLWDPYWSGGVPNDFFLRRICPYNPFYIFIILLSLLGVPYYFAYLFFLAFYLFFGMTGFYVVCGKLVGDDVAAFSSFVILLFSALATRIFDSYMLFVVTPLIWFFYFLICFASSPNRMNVLGMTFFSMILFTTYIPLYFLVIFLSFVIVFMLVYHDKLFGIARKMTGFIAKERWMTACCVGMVLLAVLPGYVFFQEAGRGGIAIPGRHFNAVESHALAVQSQAEDSWAVPEEFFFSAYYHDLKRITFAIVYVPCFAFIPLVLGFGLRISRLMVFLAIWGAFIILMTSPFGSPLYSFLRDKVFFFKYFRNLHFLLWFVILPVFSLFVGEMLRSFRDEASRQGSGNRWLVFWLVIVHVFLLGFVCWQPYALLTTKITVVLSAAFFIFYSVSPDFRKKDSLICGAVLTLIIVQPLAVYYYFSKNVFAKTVGFYDDLRSGYQYTMYTFGEGKKEGDPARSMKYGDKPQGGLYFATSYYNDLRSNIAISLVAANERYRFMAYDQVDVESVGHIEWTKLAQYWLSKENKALIEGGYSGPMLIGDGSLRQPMALGRASEVFRIIKGNTDKVVLSVNFSRPKLLVFNDAFFEGWRATVNGQAIRVWRVNGAFKGVTVPAGPARVVFSFGSFWQRCVNWMLLVIFYGVAAVLCVGALKRRETLPRREDM